MRQSLPTSKLWLHSSHTTIRTTLAYNNTDITVTTGMIADEFGALRPVSHSIGGADTEAEEAAELTPTQVLDTSTTGLTTSTSASASQFAQTSHALHNHLAWYVHGMPMFSTLSDASTDMCA